jgi:hypothetical protein
LSRRQKTLLPGGIRRRIKFLEREGHGKNPGALSDKVANSAQKCLALASINLAPPAVAIDGKRGSSIPSVYYGNIPRVPNRFKTVRSLPTLTTRR